MPAPPETDPPDNTASALTFPVETLPGPITGDRQQADYICRLCDEDACPEAICPVECAARRAEAAA